MLRFPAEKFQILAALFGDLRVLRDKGVPAPAGRDGRIVEEANAFTKQFFDDIERPTQKPSLIFTGDR